MIDSNQILYEAWSEVARRHRSELALLDVHTAQQWTFEQLFEEGERRSCPGGPVVFPQGHNPEFIFDLLAAWRIGRPTCPIEVSQTGKSTNVTGLPSEDSIVHIKTTSASTGTSKSILFTAQQLAADARNIVTTMGLCPECPNLGVISLAHSYGFSNLVLPLLLHGIPLIIVPAPLPELLLNSAAKFSALTLPAVPALWRTWLASGSIPSSVRLAISAGAPLPVELESTIFNQFGLKVHNFYGSSECGGIAYDRTRTPRADSRLAGSALDNVRLSLAEGGTIVVQGDAVGSTYWPEGRPELQNARFVTADLADFVADEVYLRGRSSDLINVAGRKVAPDEIESALRAHPAVRECVIFGVPCNAQERFETIVATVNCQPPTASSDLKAFLSTQMPGWQVPREWWFCDELAVDQRGKLSRDKWRRKYLQRMVDQRR